ncbi:hypothetical protein B0T26DRAFT_618072, partial [Lasiosphaeria miniovina]
RPERALQERLDQYRKLRVQDLTRNDIRRYVTSTLRPYFTSTSNSENISSRHREFIDALCSKAEGVFLWVRVVVRSLQKGLTNQDSINDLYQRLGTYPGDLHNLFNDMWNRLGEDAKVYQAKAAKLLNLIIQ